MLTETQIGNLQDLKALMRKVLREKRHYDHTTIDSCGTPCCALGHAGAVGIGRLKLINSWVYTPNGSHQPTSAEEVFGEGSWETIFACFSPREKWGPRRIIRAINEFIEQNKEH